MQDDKCSSCGAYKVIDRYVPGGEFDESMIKPCNSCANNYKTCFGFPCEYCTHSVY
jgi:hypothetical protein